MRRIDLDDGSFGRRFGEGKTAPVDPVGLESLLLFNLGLLIGRKASVVMCVMFVGGYFSVRLGLSTLVGDAGIEPENVDKRQTYDDQREEKLEVPRKREARLAAIVRQLQVVYAW